MKRYISTSALLLCAAMAVHAQLPEISEAVIEELGSTSGTPLMSGFIFIDGRYLPPPYTVTRRGNGIFINRILAEVPLQWPRGVVTPEIKPGDTLDQDGDFEVVAPAQTQGQPAAEQVATPKVIQTIDDLFGDAPTPVAEQTPEPDETPLIAPVKPEPVGNKKLKIDDLFTDDAPSPAPRPFIPRPLPERPSVTPVAPLTPAEPVIKTAEMLAREKEQTIEALDRIRKNYEQAIGRGEIFLFGQRHNRINGTYGSARALIGVLPNALRQASSPQDLQVRLQQGGIYFLDVTICTELLKNKTTFPLLAERLKKIEESEALEAMKRKQERRW